MTSLATPAPNPSLQPTANGVPPLAAAELKRSAGVTKRMSMPGFDYHLECRSCKERSPTYPLHVRAMHEPIVSLPAWSRTQRRWIYLSIQVAENEFMGSVADKRRLQELASGLSSAGCTVGVPRAHEGIGLVIEPEPECPYCGGKVVIFALGKEQGV